jgi:hypothetical protein
MNTMTIRILNGLCEEFRSRYCTPLQRGRDTNSNTTYEIVKR